MCGLRRVRGAACLLLYLGLALGLVACHGVVTPRADAVIAEGQPEADVESIAGQRVVKTDREWRRQLSSKAYRITRRRKTETAWSGEYVHEKAPGVYRCIGCGLALFPSETKFDAKCGWPSFFAPIDDAYVSDVEDRRGGMRRTEVRCTRCDAHLGHVFARSSLPTGRRYCINSVALAFEPAVAAPPANERVLPPLDTASHGTIETATFALG